VLAQLLGAQQVLGGGRQVVTLEGDLTHPHVHVRRSPQRDEPPPDPVRPGRGPVFQSVQAGAGSGVL